MQTELRARFGDFFKVVRRSRSATAPTPTCTSASSPPTTAPATQPRGGCDASPGGQRGLLQTLPSPNATNPPAGCVPPTGGAPYIAYAFGAGGADEQPAERQRRRRARAASSPAWRRSAPRLRLRAPARVGLRGAAQHEGERRLPARRRAPRRRVRDQRGRRLGAADGEVLREQRRPTGTSAYGQYASYRQTRFAVAVRRHADSLRHAGRAARRLHADAEPDGATRASPTTSSATSTSSRGRRSQGGVKIDPHDVILVGLDGPETPFSTILFDTTQGQHALSRLRDADAVDGPASRRCSTRARTRCSRASSPIRRCGSTPSSARRPITRSRASAATI